MSDAARKGFEDLVVWQKARVLTKAIYKVSQKGAFARDFGLSSQVQRASVSVMSNVAEGHERGGRAEFHQFLSVARGSCAELRSQLYVALDAEYLSQTEFDALHDQAEKISKMLSKLQASVKEQRERDKKPKP